MIYQPLFPHCCHDGCGINVVELCHIEYSFLKTEIESVPITATYGLNSPAKRESLYLILKGCNSSLATLFDPHKSCFSPMDCDTLYEWYLSRRDSLDKDTQDMADRFMARFDIARMNDGVVRRGRQIHEGERSTIYQPLFPYRCYGGCEVDDMDMHAIMCALLMAELKDDIIRYAQLSYPELMSEVLAKLTETPLKLLFDTDKTIFDTMECDALYEWYKSKRDAIPEESLSKCDRFMTRFDIARMNDGVVRRCTQSE